MHKKDEPALKAMAYLKAKMSVDGVAAIKFEDGEMFMFSRDMVQRLQKSMDEKGSDEVLVFVKSGHELKDS